ncbi:MAG TPA: oxidoreductase-like domain-containing protein [Paraburkholderia sp.]|nr:oxidoreductase-like domain-containing protein [Paraburkholderia sp.]
MTQASLKDDPPPVPPVQPELEDCCNSGCNPCVFDLYQSELERYRTALAEWQDRQTRQAQASANSRSRARRAHADKPARPRS